MSIKLSPPFPNRLLTALPVTEREQLQACCDTVELHLAEVLAEPGGNIEYVYFPTGSFVSLVAPIGGNSNLEVGMVGNEGVLGASLALGVNIWPLRALVQGPGQALRLSADGFSQRLGHSPGLRALLGRYLYVVLGQLAQTAACTRFHVVEARLARWLLMTADRAHGDGFHITHEFLAYMLGVRRVGVTKAATSLQRQHLIHYTRGDITILDRPGLEAASCTCYASDKARYTQILG